MSTVNSLLSFRPRPELFRVTLHHSSESLFTVVEAAALIHLRHCIFYLQLTLHCSQPYTFKKNPPIALTYMPLETEYSDDINFNNPCLETLQVQQLFSIAKSVFEGYNLFINPSKTEYVHFYLADPKPKMKTNDKGSCWNCLQLEVRNHG